MISRRSVLTGIATVSAASALPAVASVPQTTELVSYTYKGKSILYTPEMARDLLKIYDLSVEKLLRSHVDEGFVEEVYYTSFVIPIFVSR